MTATTGKKGFHRAWLVFIGVCMMMAGGMGLVLNVIGNYFVPLAAEFGLVNPETGAPDVTSLTLIMTAYSYVMLVWLPICGQLFDKVDARILFGGCGILIVISLLLMTIWTEPWQIYITGGMWGIAGPPIFLVGPSFLINNWFSPKHAGKFLGISSAFTGVGTFVWSPVFAAIISTFGFRTGFLIEAIIAAVLIVFPAIFFFRTRPEDVGLEPWGIEKEADSPKESQMKVGVSAKFAVGKIGFWAILIAAGFLTVNGGYRILMPTAVQSVGGPDLAVLGAWMVSAAAIGNITGKIILGILAEKIGIKNSILGFCAVVAVGFILMFFFMGDNVIPMLIAGYCIGVSDAEVSVGMPIATRECFGDRCYGKIYSYVNMPVAILGGLGATFVALVNTATGSYQNAYACGVIVAIIVATGTTIACVTAKKFRDKWTAEGEPEATRG